MEEKCKILIAYHKPSALLKSNIFIPIHAGRDVALEKSKDGAISENDLTWLLKNTIGDNTGDNISYKNRYYSECSAIYWAWKNYDKLDNPEYIGLMHYRRHFIFNKKYYNDKKKNKIEKIYEVSFEDAMNKHYIDKIGLKDENVLKFCCENDVVVSKDTHFELYGDINLRTDYTKYIEGTKIQDFDLMIETVKKMYPEYSNVLDANINGYSKLSFSMFLMKKELFFEYCEFLFNILFEMEKSQNFDDYSLNGKRTPGYIAEILLTIFIWRLKEKGETKIEQLGITKLEYTYTQEEIQSLINAKCPSYFAYLLNKLKFIFAIDSVAKQKYKEKYKKIRRDRKEYFNIRKIYGV